MVANANPNLSSDPNARAVLLPVIGPDGLPRESHVIANTEKIIEEEQLQLHKYIQEVIPRFVMLSENWKSFHGDETYVWAKRKQAWEEAAKAVKVEEAFKQKLCEDLNINWTVVTLN